MQLGRERVEGKGSRRSARWVACFTCGALALALACKDDEPPPAETKAEAPAEKKPAVDEKIANAMAAAEASARSEAGSAQSQTAPPADGILTPEAAARELPPGSPAQLVLGGEGSAPKVRLGLGRLAPGNGPAGKLVVSYRSAGAVMPTVEADLKPKVVASGAATQPASVSAADSNNLDVVVALGNVRPSDNQPGRLPDNARAEIAKLSGSSVELTLTPSGALLSERQKLAGNNPDLEPLLTGSTEALAGALLPYPEVPVGVGAFWMIKSRETANGASVLAYRMVKLTALTPELATLSVNTRRYLLEARLPTPGLPPHVVRRFEGQGDSTLSLRPGALYPEKVESRDSFAALVTPSDRPNQAIPMQAELSATTSFAR